MRNRISKDKMETNLHLSTCNQKPSMAPVATPSDCNESTTWVQVLAGKNVVLLGTCTAVWPTVPTVAWIWRRRPVFAPGLTKNLG